MAKNVDHIQHIKSNVVLENGKPKLPESSNLVEGELAINYAEGVETISIKNSNSGITTFSSDDYYTEKKLGEYFTGEEGSAKTVTDVMIEKERVTAEAILDLRRTKADAEDTVWEKGEGENSAALIGGDNEASGTNSVAEGYNTKASASYSHAEGNASSAITIGAHAEGRNTRASGNYSHAEGYNTKAQYSYSHAEGESTFANATGAHAEGYGSLVYGNYAHAEGYQTVASGESSHAEGKATTASTALAHAEGWLTLASQERAHAEGYFTRATSYNTHAEGYNTQAIQNNAHAEGQSTLASGTASHAEGYTTSATSQSSHAEGQSTKATAQAAHAEGYYTVASGYYSHAEGYDSVANAYVSHAEGYQTSGTASYTHAEGYQTKASGSYSHTEGYYTRATAAYSHAEGCNTSAVTDSSHSEGYNTKASGYYSHAEGYDTSATTQSSHAEGQGTLTRNQSEHASGQYNVSNYYTSTFGNSGNTLFSVGNGYSAYAKHNVFEIRQNGDIYVSDPDDTTSTYYNRRTVKLQDVIGKVNTDQVIDSTTSASTNPVATKAVYNVMVENEEIIAAALSELENTKVGNVEYDPTGQTINFYSSGSSEATLIASIDVSDFAVDTDQVIDSTTSASTNPVSTSAVYDKFVEDEEVWAISYNQLNNDKFGHAEFDSTANTINFYDNDGTGNTVIGSVDLSSFSIDVDQVIDSGTSASTDAVSTSAVYGFVTSYTPSITVDQDFSDTASTNPISTKAVYSAITDNELVWTNAYVALSGTVSAHTASTDIHVTAADKTAWDAKLDATAYTPVNESSGITAMTGYAMAASGTPISTSDTLNAAIGKLEKMIDELKDYIQQKEMAIAAAITDLDDRLKAIE